MKDDSINNILATFILKNGYKYLEGVYLLSAQDSLLFIDLLQKYNISFGFDGFIMHNNRTYIQPEQDYTKYYNNIKLELSYDLAKDFFRGQIKNKKDVLYEFFY